MGRFLCGQTRRRHARSLSPAKATPQISIGSTGVPMPPAVQADLESVLQAIARSPPCQRPILGREQKLGPFPQISNGYRSRRPQSSWRRRRPQRPQPDLESVQQHASSKRRNALSLSPGQSLGPSSPQMAKNESPQSDHPTR